jgi:hypothetical protein
MFNTVSKSATYIIIIIIIVLLSLHVNKQPLNWIELLQRFCHYLFDMVLPIKKVIALLVISYVWGFYNIVICNDVDYVLPSVSNTLLCHKCSVACKMKVKYFHFMQRWVVVLYRRFGTTYWSHIHGSKSPAPTFRDNLSAHLKGSRSLLGLLDPLRWDW